MTKYVRTTNHAGGIEGGISNGEMIRVSGYLKPLFSMAPRMRTRPSFTPASGRPTMWQPGRPLATSTST